VPAAGAPSPAAAAGAYVALGDSYSSGVGAGRYVAGSGACLRSPRSYVHRIGRGVTSFRACSGATTGTVLRGQLAPFPDDTRLVTITIGGNDAGFIDVIQACLFGAPADCGERVARAERFVRRSLAGRLRRVYDAIRRRAPRATVVVAGYPRLFARRPWCSRVGEIDDREQRRLNEAADLLARVTAAEVRRHRRFRFADVRAAFDDGGICSRAPLIRGVSDPPASSFHPNVAGYRTYARVIGRRL
jgi:lysophospholipase L1-like esterase